jgi:hypothetical protein
MAIISTLFCALAISAQRAMHRHAVNNSANDPAWSELQSSMERMHASMTSIEATVGSALECAQPDYTLDRSDGSVSQVAYLIQGYCNRAARSTWAFDARELRNEIVFKTKTRLRRCSMLVHVLYCFGLRSTNGICQPFE